MRFPLALPALCLLASLAGPAPAADLDACLEARPLARVARMAGPSGRPVYVRVEAATDGVPTGVVPIAEAGADLADVFARAAQPTQEQPWQLTRAGAQGRTCSPMPLAQADLDGEQRVIVAAGLNYGAHAEEAGGGEVFLFPKPAAPTGAYAEVAAPAGVTLLDYEVELGFVLLADVSLTDPPTREALLATAAFFVANDVSDREPIIREKSFSGPGTGFVRGKGQDGFLPAGPWMVRGRELFAALEACGAPGLGLHLDVDEGDGFRARQEASTELLILDLEALVRRVADEVAANGLRTAMPMERGGATRFYPLAVPGPDGPVLPAGSVILTGTPEGVALQAPNPAAAVLRGLLRLRSPFEQFARDELARAAKAAPGGYLEPGDRVRARIDGLGSQIIRVVDAGSTPAPDPCALEVRR